MSGFPISLSLDLDGLLWTKGDLDRLRSVGGFYQKLDEVCSSIRKQPYLRAISFSLDELSRRLSSSILLTGCSVHAIPLVWSSLH